MAQLLRLSFWLLLLWSSALPLAAQEAVPSTLPLASIAEALRGGGYVVYFRHADTGTPGAEPPNVDLNRCETQRNLIDRGRDQVGRQCRLCDGACVITGLAGPHFGAHAVPDAECSGNN